MYIHIYIYMYYCLASPIVMTGSRRGDTPDEVMHGLV